MKDKEFLIWLHNRLTQLYGENPNYDCMQKLESIANRTPDDQDTCIGVQGSVEDKIAVFRMKYVGTGSGMDLLELIEALNKRVDKIEKG